MAVDSKHPDYAEFLQDWSLMWDTYRGERRVKEEGRRYLPPTSGMVADGFGTAESLGQKAYEAYRLRAVFHDYVSDAVEAMLGIMHHKPADIQLPSQMEDMRENATIHGESLQALLRRINERQLITGRLGVLADLPETATNETILPYLAVYDAKHIVNWDDGRRDSEVLQQLNFVSLDETEWEREADFDWVFRRKFRVLSLGDPQDLTPETARNYQVGVFRDDGGSKPGEKGGESSARFTTAGQITPSLRGRTLERIPFVFINTKDVVPKPDDPPLLGLAKIALAIYRLEADYRQALFMQGQDTLVTTGGTDDGVTRIGANAEIKLPLGGDAKFIGVESGGLPEMRKAIDADRGEATMKSAQMLDNRTSQAESGDALRIRVAARTATLNQLAITGAFGLQESLRIVAEWMNLNPDDVVVTPNLDFAMDSLTGKELMDLIGAKNQGFPISLETLHRIAREKDITDLDFEEELDKIEDEGEGLGIGNDNNDEPDDDDGTGSTDNPDDEDEDEDEDEE